MGVFGCGKPKVYFLYPDDPSNLNTNYTLPDPARVVPSWEPVRHRVQTRQGNIYIKSLGYRYSVEFTWSQMSSTDFGQLIKMANWEGNLLLIPHIDHDLIGFNVEIELQQGYPKDKVVEIDTVTAKFTSLNVTPIRDYDNLINAQNGWFCDDNPLLSAGGANLLVNGSFGAWTGDDPDSWTVTETIPNGNVTESPENQANIISTDGTAARVSQIVLTLGVEYLAEIEIPVTGSGSLLIVHGASSVAIPVTAGKHLVLFTAAGAIFGIQNGGVCNVSIDSASVRQTTDTDMILTTDEIIYN